MYNDLAGSVQGVDKFILLLQKLNQSKTEKERIAQEVCELLNDKDKRQELETLTPSLLQTGGEAKFRQCFNCYIRFSCFVFEKSFRPLPVGKSFYLCSSS